MGDLIGNNYEYGKFKILNDEKEIWQKKNESNNNNKYDVNGVIEGTYGGLTFIDEKIISAQSGVIKDLLQQLGRNIMERKSLVNISLPVTLFESRSFLERIVDVWYYAPLYLTKAANINNNPLERLKYTICFLIAGLHRGSKQVKPFNPILGETYQAIMMDGTNIFCEQISHHPPITQFEVKHKELWSFEGCHEYQAHFTPSGIEGGQYGPNCIRFGNDPNDFITFSMPPVRLSGLVMGERNFTYFDNITFKYAKYNLEAKLNFNPDGYSGFTSWVATAATPSDTIRGEIKKNGKLCCSIKGSWIKHLLFDEKPYWKIGEYKGYAAISLGDKALPSDSLRRTDILYLKANNIKKAQAEKQKLEELQRADAKLRKTFKKSMINNNEEEEDANLESSKSGWGIW